MKGDHMKTLTFDFTKDCGPIRPMHGVGQPPMMGTNTRCMHYLSDAGIP